MAGRNLPGQGLRGGFEDRSKDWGADMNTNLFVISVKLGGRAKSRATALPANPAPGDVYLVPANAGATANQIAAYDNGAWRYASPFEGDRFYVQDEKVFVDYLAGAWVVEKQPATPAAKDVSANDPNDTSFETVQGQLDYLTSKAEQPVDVSGKEDKANKGQKNGYAGLDGDGFVPAAQIRASTATTLTPSWYQADHTLTLDDAGRMLLFNGGAASTLTIPQDGDVALPIGTYIGVTRFNSQKLTIKAAGGVTIRQPVSKTLSLYEEGSEAVLMKVTANAWIFQGDLESVV